MATNFYRDEYLQWVNHGAILNENVTSLSLGNEPVIRELTDSINNLPNLGRIVLAGSETITAIPSSVASLNKLKLLDLDRTAISTLPEELRNFEQNIEIMVEDTPLFKNPPPQLQTWPSNIIFKPPLFGQPRINAIIDKLEDNYAFRFDEYLEWISIGCPIIKSVNELILESDDLNAQPITVILDQISNLINLQKIVFVDIDITELPSSIVTLAKLHSIKIQNTFLESLPENIGNLKKLKYLELKQCHLETLPQSIVELTNLVELNFEDTPLESLPPNIGQLTKLKILNLAYTDVDFLRPNIGQLTKLQILNLTNTDVETLPESLKNINHTVGIAIGGTPIISNPAYVLQLRSWPSRFKISPLPAPPPAPVVPPTVLPAPEPLANIRSQVNPYVGAKDIINVNDDDTAQQFLNLNQGYKIFICRELYYATSLDLLSGYINNQINEYYICNRLPNGGFQRTNTNPLISINIITGFQGYVKKAQLLTALNSPNNYFALSEQSPNIAVIKGHPNSTVSSVCQEANAKLYEIKNIDVIDRGELMSNLKNKTDYSDIFKDVDSEKEDEIFNDVASENGDNSKGGRTRKGRKGRKGRKTRKTKKIGKTRKYRKSRSRKSRRR